MNNSNDTNRIKKYRKIMELASKLIPRGYPGHKQIQKIEANSAETTMNYKD